MPGVTTPATDIAVRPSRTGVRSWVMTRALALVSERLAWIVDHVREPRVSIHRF